MASFLFSIIVVCFNPGEKLKKTVESILEQSEKELEILIKDGNSTDGSLGTISPKDCIRVIRQPDTGIYDAMNQAAAQAGGEILFFLNCGDVFHDRDVLKRVREFVKGKENKIFYGDIYSVLSGSPVSSNPHMDEFGCYRNVPCHQACFYRNELFAERGYLLQYKVRADYEHFLWSYYEKKADPFYMPVMIADYEGGGFSETKENRKLSAKEHREITAKYMGRGKRFKFRMILWLTLAPVRSRLAQSRHFSGLYNGLKERIYKKRGAVVKSDGQKGQI